jgi:molybdopterin molybdotransferase
LDETAAVLGARLASDAIDAVVTIGGVSVGDYDLVPKALELLGARVVLHKVAVKPGKPFLFALSREGKPLFGLPGNPLSALASFFEFVAPALRKMAGRPEPWAPTLPVRLTAAAPGDRDRHHLVLARVSQDEDGQWLAEPLIAAHSADVTAAAFADGVVHVPAGLAEVPAGQVVSFRPWRPLW